MPPRTPEQLAADFRRRQLPQVQAPQLPQQQPQPVTNNYMGPPEAPVQAEEPARAGPTGFVGFGQQLAANQEVAQRMAAQAGQAAAGSEVGSLKTDAGRTALLQRAYGKAAQVTDLDAALAGGAGGDYFAQLAANYGPEAQARQAQQRKDAQAAGVAMQARMGQEAQRVRQAQAAAEEKRVQDEVLALRGRGNNMQTAAGRVRGVTPEQWAAMHGMTLEQWVRNGKRPAY